MINMQKEIAKKATPLAESKPFIEWKYKYNEKTGHYEFDTFGLSAGVEKNADTFQAAIKATTGTSDPEIAERIIKKTARAMVSSREDVRLNDVSSLLPALQPKDETEALLLGQFLALQDSGMKCLQLANVPEQGFYHIERLFALANKLFNAANQTMQTVLKYRSGGQQTVQVVHVHNEGQAIVTQNLSPAREGACRKNVN